MLSEKENETMETESRISAEENRRNIYLFLEEEGFYWNYNLYCKKMQVNEEEIKVSIHCEELEDSRPSVIIISDPITIHSSDIFLIKRILNDLGFILENKKKILNILDEGAGMPIYIKIVDNFLYLTHRKTRKSLILITRKA